MRRNSSNQNRRFIVYPQRAGSEYKSTVLTNLMFALGSAALMALLLQARSLDPIGYVESAAQRLVQASSLECEKAGVCDLCRTASGTLDRFERALETLRMSDEEGDAR